MKKIFLMISPLLLAWVFCGCVQGNSHSESIGFTNGPTIKGSDRYVTKNLTVKPFDKIVVTGSLDVEYTQDAGKYQVDLYASDNIIDLIDVHSQGRTLYLSFKKNVSVSYKKLKISVTGKELNDVSLTGSGDFAFKNGLKAESVNLSLVGSGDIMGENLTCSQNITMSLSGSGDLNCGNVTAKSVDISVVGSGDVDVSNIDVASVTASVSGSGDIALKGKARKAEYNVSGSGDISAANVVADEVSASVGGSGDIECHAVKTLNLHTGGSGTIGYKGNPTMIGNTKHLRRL